MGKPRMLKWLEIWDSTFSSITNLRKRRHRNYSEHRMAKPHVFKRDWRMRDVRAWECAFSLTTLKVSQQRRAKRTLLVVASTSTISRWRVSFVESTICPAAECVLRAEGWKKRQWGELKRNWMRRRKAHMRRRRRYKEKTREEENKQKESRRKLESKRS